MIQFYRIEWKKAEKEGKTEYANNCKDQYRLLVMQNLEQPYRQYEDKLKAYGALYLN